MIFIPTENLKPGMIMAKDIYMDLSFFPLLTKSQVLNDFMIQRLRIKEIPGVYVKSDFGDDIVVKSIIDDRVRQTTIIGMKDVFTTLENTTEFTRDNFKNVSNMAQDLVLEIISNDDLLINMIELKSYNNYTYYHSLCVSIISVVMGIKLGLEASDLNNLAICGLLHDIGKTMIPLEILDKPSTLTKEEFDIIKEHPSNARTLLESNRSVLYEMLNGIKGHHERFDGTGYPDGLSGHDIPLFSRILAIADVYDALTSQRSYRKACFPKDAIEYMMGCAETHFETELLNTFLQTVAVYPVGTLVMLSTGERAVVVKNYAENTLRPVIRILDEDGEHIREIDLLHDRDSMSLIISGMGYDQEGGNFATLDNIVTKKRE